jgi:hypothetical protein
LHCRHCNCIFRGKPTWRKVKRLWTFNHASSDMKRLQYIIGKKHRKCKIPHEGGCINFYDQPQLLPC